MRSNRALAATRSSSWSGVRKPRPSSQSNFIVFAVGGMGAETGSGALREVVDGLVAVESVGVGAGND